MEGRVVVFVFGIFDLTKMVFFSKIILRSKWKNWCRCSHSEDKRNSSKWVVLTQISETLVFKRVQLQGLTYELEINSTSVCSNYEEVCFVSCETSTRKITEHSALSHLPMMPPLIGEASPNQHEMT